MTHARDDNFIEPAPTTPATHADELFTHGLLEHLHHDSPAARETRINSLLSRLDATESATPSHRFRIPHFNRIGRFTRAALAAAAVVAITTSFIYFGASTERSANATVQESISAMRSSGDRRYEVRTKFFDSADLSTEAQFVIDTRAPDLMFMQSKGSGKREIRVGRDESGIWGIRPDGTIDRNVPENVWPRWATLNDESLFADSVDQLLESMSQSYTMTRGEGSKLQNHGDTKFNHIIGTRIGAARPGPSRVDFWIDPASKVVERMEMRFDAPPPGPAGGKEGPLGEGAPRDGELHDGEQADGPPRPRGPRPPPGAGGPGGSGGPEGTRGLEGFDRPPPPDRDRPDFDRPPPRHNADEARDADHGADTEKSALDAAPRGDHHPERRDGPDGPAGPDGRPRRFGRPDPRRGLHPEHFKPLELLVIERVPAPVFAGDYFSPESHQKKSGSK